MSLSESSGSQLSLQPWPDRSQLSRWTGLFLYQRLNSSPEPFIRRPSHSGPFLAPRKPRNSGRTSPSPVPQPAVGVVVLEPCQGASGGTENHPAPDDPKLGQLPRARQGLVRVPESNTKYGGKAGKTGVARLLCHAQVSVSPQGFQSEKNVLERSIRASPHCSQGKYFLQLWGCAGKTHVKLRESPGWHVRRSMASGPDTRQGAADFDRFIP